MNVLELAQEVRAGVGAEVSVAMELLAVAPGDGPTALLDPGGVEAPVVAAGASGT